MKAKILRSSPFILLAIALFWGSLSAQEFRLDADIPFSFTVENANLPAGKYLIRQLGPNELSISSEKGDVFVYFITEFMDRPTPVKDSELVFNLYGDKHFLSEIWQVGEASGLYLIKSRTEHKLLKNEPRKTEKVKAVKK